MEKQQENQASASGLSSVRQKQMRFLANTVLTNWRHATFDASTRDVVASATSDTRRATYGRQSTLRRATLWLVRRATRDVQRTGDNRRLDARRGEKPTSKSNILSEHSLPCLPLGKRTSLKKKELGSWYSEPLTSVHYFSPPESPFMVCKPQKLHYLMVCKPQCYGKTRWTN